MSPLATEPLADPAAIAQLGDVMRAAGFTGQRLRQALGLSGAALAGAADRVVHARTVAELGALGTLARLFVLELPVGRAALEDAVAPLSVDDLARFGLVQNRDGEVDARVRIVPHDEILIVSDRRAQPGEAMPADYVAGVHAPSLTLAHLSVRRVSASALDLGAGCGIQSILISRHSERVTAVDLNARALAFARFTAALNGVTNLELGHGSYIEPVAERRFDLVVSNPPYVISPESEVLFRDSGLPGDSVSQQVVRAAASVLAEDGFATILVSWIHEPGGSWAAPLREWIADSGCDAWLLHYATVDPLTHATSWNRELAAQDEAAFEAAIERWLAYLGRLGIDAIATGAVILRRRSAGPNWVREDEMPQEGLAPASDHILRVFAAQDRLAGLADERELLADRFELAERARLEQSVVLREGEWAVDGITLSLQEGLGFRVAVDRDTAALLACLDGQRSLGEALNEMTSGADASDAVRARIAASAVPVVRTLYEAGFLVRNG